MDSIMSTIKFVAMTGLIVFVVLVVGATVIAGLYQLIRDKVHSLVGKVRESRVPRFPAVSRKS